MALEWMPRDNGPKDHRLHSDIHFGTDADAPCVVYEKRPLKDASGKIVESLYTAWISTKQSEAVQFLHNGNGQGRNSRLRECIPG